MITSDNELRTDIAALYARGYITDLSELPVTGQATREQLIATLRRAGYTDAQIADRDYV